MNTNYLHFGNAYFRLESTKLTSQLVCSGLWNELTSISKYKILVKENLINGCYNLKCWILPIASQSGENIFVNVQCGHIITYGTPYIGSGRGLLR